MRKTDSYSYNVNWVYGILIAQITILALLRYLSTQTLFTFDSLQLLHQVNLISQTGGLYDPLIAGGRILSYSSFPYLFFAIQKILNSQITLLVFQLVFPLGLIWGLHQLGKSFEWTKQKIFFMLLVVALSPTLIAWSFVSPVHVGILVLQILGLLLLSKKNSLGFILLAGAAAEGWVTVLITLLLALIFFKNKSISLNQLVALMFIQSLVATAALIPQLILHESSAPLLIMQQKLASTLIELGALKGLSIIICSLAALGAVVLYKRRYFLEASLMIIITLLSIWFESFRLPAAIGMAMLTGLFIDYLIHYNWELEVLRTVSLGTIAVGILGATLVISTQLIAASPTLEQGQTAQWINQNLPQEAVIFAMQDQAIIIEAIGNRTVIIDNNLQSIPQAKVKQNISENLLNEVYLPEAQKTLKNLSITHLYIGPDLYEGKDENDPSGGLIYLLKNNETFKSVYKDKGHRVIKYLKNGQEP